MRILRPVSAFSVSATLSTPALLDRPVQSGALIISGEDSRRRARLGALVFDGTRLWGLSARHFFGQASDSQVSSANGKRIGRYARSSEVNGGSDATPGHDQIGFFEISPDVKVDANDMYGGSAFTGIVDEYSVRNNKLYRYNSDGQILEATVLRNNAGAYVEALGDPASDPKHVTGGWLVQPARGTAEFAPQGESGTMLFDADRRAAGILLAADDEVAFVVPVGEVLKRNRLQLLNEWGADAWNSRQGFRIHQTSGPIPSNRQSYVFSSEAVADGHPDKVCDRISDEIVDLAYREAAAAGYPASTVRVVAETLATTNRVVLAGEIRTNLEERRLRSKVRAATRKAIRSIGYEQDGFHWRMAKIEVLLHPQSADIALGVDTVDLGSGDQTTVFGYACADTPDLMPAPVYYANKILEVLAIARHAGEGPVANLGPDGKSQITVRYENGRPVGVTQIVLSLQHLDDAMSSADVRKIVTPYVLRTLPQGWVTKETVWHVNPTGKFVIGGPDGDSGLTGRRVSSDSYGGSAPSSTAFSGKDATKIDRAAAYAARYLAKNVVATKLADRCTVQLAYSIGVARPVSIYVDLHGTGKVDEAKLERILYEMMDLSPRGIRAHLDLDRPIYAKTAAFGHFGRKPGRDGSFSWERTDLARGILRRLRES